jgi:phosphate transport system protein
MNEPHITGHISKRFDSELEDLRSQVLAMGGLVEEQVANGLQCLLDSNAELAEQVAGNDYKVNAREVSIDEKCVEILARRQPAASDLRLVVAIIKTITDLERIGDQAEKLGKFELERVAEGSTSSDYAQLENIGNRVVRMLHSALDAFARLDDRAALKTIKKDNKIDREFDALSRQLITHMMEDPRNIRNALRVSWCARALERIGDHASNICEYVIFLVRGKDVRHIGYQNMKKRLKKD